MLWWRCVRRPRDFGVPVISVGNLTMGGSGKTPVTKAIFELLNARDDLRGGVFIVLRGYGRVSKGLRVVAINGKICYENKSSNLDVRPPKFADCIDEFGDEATEYAISLNGANVIVCEDRSVAIAKAKEMGAKAVILDDGFSKFHIAKFDILLPLPTKPLLPLCLPSAGYRFPPFFDKFAGFNALPSDIIKSYKIIKASNLSGKFDAQNGESFGKMLLVTAIANPHRLDSFGDLCVDKIYFPDHYRFCQDELQNLLQKSGADTLLMTMKDYTKCADFSLPIAIIMQSTALSDNLQNAVLRYLSH